MTSADAATVYAEMCALWPRSPRTTTIDARRLDRLEGLNVANACGLSAAERCCDSVVAYYERLMSESKTPRTTIPFDAILADLRKLEDRSAPAPSEAVDTDTGEVYVPDDVIAAQYERDAEGFDAKAETAPNDGRIGSTCFYRKLAGACRRRAARCRQRHQEANRIGGRA